MIPICRHCKAPAQYLEPRVEYRAGGAWQVVRCIRCGWRVERPIPRESYGNAAIHPAHGTGADGRPLLPCRVEGCGGRYDETAFRAEDLGMCGKCKTRMLQWEAGKRRNNPPFVRSGELWIKTAQKFQCRVEGCTRNYEPTGADADVWPFCRPHRVLMRNWRDKASGIAAPVQLINGVWRKVSRQDRERQMRAEAEAAGAGMIENGGEYVGEN